MSQSLSFCPYCFGITPELTPCLIGFRVICHQCLATGPHKQNRDEAIFAWNQLSEKMQQARAENHHDLATRLKKLEQAVFLNR